MYQSGDADAAQTSQARAGASPSPEAIRDAIIESLRSVFDPEIPVNIYELGLIYEVTVEGDGRGQATGQSIVVGDQHRPSEGTRGQGLLQQVERGFRQRPAQQLLDRATAHSPQEDDEYRRVLQRKTLRMRAQFRPSSF